MKNKKDDISALIYAINAIHPLGENIVAFLQENCFSCTCKRGKHLIKSGEICKTLYFIKTGAIRGYIRENKRDITTWISTDNELVTSISSFDLQIPAIENIQAVEDCDMVAISYSNLQKLYFKFPLFFSNLAKSINHKILSSGFLLRVLNLCQYSSESVRF